MARTKRQRRRRRVLYQEPDYSDAGDTDDPSALRMPLFTEVRKGFSRKYSAAPTLCGKDFLCKD